MHDPWPRYPTARKTILRAARSCLVIMATMGFVLQVAPARATPPTAGIQSPINHPENADLVDIELAADSSLLAQVLGTAGNPQHTKTVVLIRSGEVAVKATTDANGGFRFKPVSGGVYQVAVGDTVTVCRAWVAGTAPPHAQPRLLLNYGQPIARGQMPLGDVFCNKNLLWGLVIAAAIAIPIAINNSKSSSS